MSKVKKLICEIVCVFILAVCLASCTTAADGENGERENVIEVSGRAMAKSDFSILDITVNGETHQYLRYVYSVSHWEGCKYCKDHANEKR